MKWLNMVKAASGRSVGTMCPAPCGRGSGSSVPAAVLPRPSQVPLPGVPAARPPQPYLDGEEGDVGEFLHEPPDLVLTSFSVEPGPTSYLHLGRGSASVPQLCPSPCRSRPQHAAACTTWSR